MVLVAAHKTDVGRKPVHNEDYIWVNQQAGIFIVADGLGGQQAGEVASHLAATTAGQYMLSAVQANPQANPQNTLIEALETANRAVWQAGLNGDSTYNMASTILLAWVQLPHVYICHAGDTRAYHLQGHTLNTLTEDHSLVAQLRAAGVLGKTEKRPFIKHVVTKAAGQEGPLDPSFTTLSLSPGDWLILCSDGFWNMVSEAQLTEILTTPPTNDLPTLVDSLVEAANHAGGKDNISLILLKVSAA
jgi:protein phosphatase